LLTDIDKLPRIMRRREAPARSRYWLPAWYRSPSGALACVTYTKPLRQSVSAAFSTANYSGTHGNRTRFQSELTLIWEYAACIARELTTTMTNMHASSSGVAPALRGGTLSILAPRRSADMSGRAGLYTGEVGAQAAAPCSAATAKWVS
jgi:hypothetical protein